jgi:hypothetical protein
MEEGPEEGARPTCTHAICAVELTAVEANFPLIDHLAGPNEAYLNSSVSRRCRILARTAVLPV